MPVWRALKALAPAVMLAAVMPSGANAIEPDAPEALISPAEVMNLSLKSELAKKVRISSPYDQRERRAVERKGLKKYYEKNGYKAIWVDDKGLNARALQAIFEMEQAARYGLEPRDYRYPDPVVLKSRLAKKNVVSARHLAAAEKKMSLAALLYASHASGSRIMPSKFTKHIDRKGPYVDPAVAMTQMASAQDVGIYLKSLHPTHQQYGVLIKALAEIRGESKKSKRQVFIPAGRKLLIGMTHPNVGLLRRRLNIPVMVNSGTPENLFDDDVRAAVVKFQKSAGLQADGIIGTRSLRVLNEKEPDNKQAILVNLERWRWMPRNMGHRHIRVNVPEFKVRVMTGKEVAHIERVVVGKRTQKTPMFSDELESVVFNPYWHVPQSIIWTEMGGRIPRGYEGEWRGNYLAVRQPPGPRNALGKIKFRFPNKHAVYLHDTPQKSLFNRDERAFSHGCMRVRNPKRLAEVVFSGEPNWNKTRVDIAYRSNINREVKLAKKVPVHVTYFTAWADDSGKLKYFKDIYGHDKRMAIALNYASGDPYRLDPLEAASRKRLKSREKLNKRRGRQPNFFNFWGNNDAFSSFNGYASQQRQKPRRRAQNRRTGPRVGNGRRSSGQQPSGDLFGQIFGTN